ncbi:MAG TPA: hypothetical protein DEW10_06650 [Bifidobacterium sp.]|nr:hypothetical protein [Bifidobacterium sp.]
MVSAWKKAVAALAAIPMLGAMIPAASAAETNGNGAGASSVRTVSASTATATAAKNTASTDADAADGTNGYLWLHFEATDYEKIYYGYSADGSNWRKLNDNKPLISSNTANKGIRDPHLIKLQKPDADGYKYVMIGTDLHAEGTASGKSWSQQSQNLIVSRSKDLVNWTDAEAVKGGWDNADRMWAPEAIYDPETKDYLVYYSAKPKNSDQLLGVYRVHTKDFKTFTQPEGTDGDPQPWVYQGTAADGTDTKENIIDSTIVKGDDGDYYRFSTSDWSTVVDTAKTLDGKWTRIVERDSDMNADGTSRITGDTVAMNTSTAGLGGIEGLTVFQKPDGTWVIMGDNQGYKARSIAKLSDLKNGVATASMSTNFPKRFRHGTIVPLTASEKRAVLKAYDGATDSVSADKAGSDPIAQYDFEDSNNRGKDSKGGNDLTFSGTPEFGVPGDWNTNVMQLRPSKNAYAEFPQGMFDGRDSFTLEFEAKSRASSGNYFSFAIGASDQKYIIIRLRGDQIYTAITDATWNAEQGVSAKLATTSWHKYAITVEPHRIAVYADNQLLGENTDVTVSVSDLGENLKAYIGKSFYSADGLWDGGVDKIKVYNYARSMRDMLGDVNVKSAVVGTVPSDPSKEVGTDDHTALYAKVDADAGTITPTVNRLASDKLAESPASFTLNRNDVPVTMTIDGQPFGTRSEDGYSIAGVLDATKDHAVEITATENDGSKVVKKWTLKAATVSNNPVLPGQYADPDIDYFPETGKFWIYPTTDGFSGWSGNYFHAWSSSDLVNWTDEGVILDVKADNKPAEGQNADPANYDGSKVDNIAFSPWSVGSAWAPTIEAKDTNNDGKMEYYFYYCAKKTNGESAIGVAVADNPAGPFKAADQPLVSRTMEGVTVGQAIDPSIFTDDDGTSYILYGNGTPAIAQLNDDMTSIKEGTVRKLSGLKDFRESVVVMKHGGKYHWTWSCDDAGSENYHVNYGVSDSLDGAITVKTEWLVGKDKNSGIQGTAHQSDVTVTDGTGRERTFMAYHRHYTPLGVFTSGLGYHRETAISEVTFDKDGYMEKIDVTKNIEPVQMAKTDYAKLEAAVEQAKALKESDYTAESWKTFRDSGKLEAAEKVLDTKDAKYTAYQTEVDAAASELTAAMGGLVRNEPVSPPASVDKSQLQAAVDAAKPESDASKYTAESWKAYREALEAAEAVLANESATQEQVDAALESLKSAESGLKTADSGETPEQPGQPGASDKPNAGGSGDDSGNNSSGGHDGDSGDKTETAANGKSTTVADTGSAIVAVAVAGIALAVAGVVLIARRHRVED